MSDLTVPCIVYTSPKGIPNYVDIPNVYKNDINYINTHRIQLSMEELTTGQYVIYFDDNTSKLEDGVTPDEVIIIVKDGETCQDAVARGVTILKERENND